MCQPRFSHEMIPSFRGWREGGYRRLRIHKWRQMKSWQTPGIIPRRNKSADREISPNASQFEKRGKRTFISPTGIPSNNRNDKGGIFGIIFFDEPFDPLFLMRYPEIDRCWEDNSIKASRGAVIVMDVNDNDDDDENVIFSNKMDGDFQYWLSMFNLNFYHIVTIWRSGRSMLNVFWRFLCIKKI